MNDSIAETLEHINQVRGYMSRWSQKILRRAITHDKSKLAEPEKSGFDEVTGALKGLTYGSDEYKAQLEKLQPILKHHYEHNSHHPEHYENGVNDMCLLDVVEMFCDWCAATQRHDDGNIHRSIEHNRERFGISPQLSQIFHNTANKHAMGRNNRSGVRTIGVASSDKAE